ncbi:diguanylate cyclase [filamentous cyanobacterium CCP2]|nr:diguanylate cyclase [filamentous cyanobacterium CCP2]
MTDFLLQPIATSLSQPINEAERLQALHRYNVLDTPPEIAFDRITSMAARLFDVPIAFVSLVDESRAWFKSCYGLKLREVPRNSTLCSFALLCNEVLVIPDTQQDDRLQDNPTDNPFAPFVQKEPGVRFYAGAPLLTQDGFNLGTLCLLDTKPGKALTEQQQATLTDLAAMVVDELELRLAAQKVSHIDAALLQISQGVSAATGEAFFYALVQHFTNVLNVDYAYIGLADGADQETIRTIAACGKGQIIDNFEYLLRDTPCREVIQQRKLCCYPSRVQALFPNAPLLEPLKIESYAAIPFFDSVGTPGLLGIMDGKPLENIQIIESLLTIFALRVTAELERQQAETSRQQAHHDLERLVENRTTELSQTNTHLSLEIAERQQAETALQTKQEMLNILLDHVQVGIVACDAEGILTLFNQTAREFHGLPNHGPMGQLLPDQWAEQYDLYMPDGKTRMPKEEIPLFRALQGQTVHNVEMIIAPHQGTRRTLLASGRAIVDAQGNKQGAVVAMHDITERKQIEAERSQLIQEQIREQTARLEAEAGQRRAAFLVEVSTALAASLEYERTLASVADLVVPFFADWCAIDLVNYQLQSDASPDSQSIHRVAVAHRDPDKAKLGWELHRRYPQQQGATEGVPKVLRTGQAEMAAEIPDATLAAVAHDAEHLQILRELGLKSCIVSPLIARGQILGAISFVTAESDRRYSPSDLALAEDIAHRAAIAIDNARLYREAQQAQQAAERSAERIARLQSVTAACSESMTPDQVAEVIVEQGMAALGASFAMVALLNEMGSELEVVRVEGSELEQVEGWHRFSVNSPVPLAEAVRTGQPIWVEPTEQRVARYPHLAEHYQQQHFGAWVSIPLTVEGRTVGGMSFAFAEPELLNEEEQAFILSLSQQCAQAIVRTHLYEAERIARSEAVREAERSADANRIKDEFLAILSHELRSPLNPILGWVKMLRSGMLDTTKTAHALETIERNAKLQTQLIEDLLDVSRILQGKLSLTTVPVSLTLSIQAALETVRLAAEAKNIQIQTILNPPDVQVLGDSARLQQIVWNLLSNAVKFTPPGGQVTIRLDKLTEFAQIQVCDTGKGIQPDFLPYVFDYFRQADSTTTRKFGGLGLGLAIVRHLAELHGGTVQAESQGEGQGATFTVRLPLLKDGGETCADQDSLFTDVSLNLQPLQGIRVLLVDDEADARDLVEFILKEAGAIVQAVDSAQSALAWLERFQPDILVSDIGMPEENGYSLLSKIRTLPAERGGQVPAIALTAYAREEDRNQALAVGFQQHLSKPVALNDLIQAIKNLTCRL